MAAGNEIIVAIDGPAGAGKSSVARRAAAAIGFSFLDTGAMYRAATWWAMHNGTDLSNPEALLGAVRAMALEIHENGGFQNVIVNGYDVTQEIRSPEVTRNIFHLDQCPAVRDILVAKQQEMGSAGRIVAEGRDIGTVVFPRARCKIYLDASIDERTRRRADELAARGIRVNTDTLRSEIEARDQKDMTREVSPLRRAEDAVVIDTTHMTSDEVVDAIVRLARERLS
ncbi:MAG: cytidylate kinase [Candidatus Hydrogenedentota bacterium]